jgi:hypothetical protein
VLARRSLEIDARAAVAGEGGRADLGDDERPAVLLDLRAERGRLARSLAELVAGRSPDEHEVPGLALFH